ncbi:transposase [Streptomyces sp. SPB78]|nr:transposase [Streptomyces sp. SPB78]
MGVVRARGAGGPGAAAGRWSAAAWGPGGARRDHVRGHFRLHLAADAGGVRAVMVDGVSAVHRVE